MSFTPFKAGASIPMFNQLAPMMGFALGASGLLPKLIGEENADKLSAGLTGQKMPSTGGNYGGGGIATSANRPGDDFSGGPGHYGGGPGYGGPSTFAGNTAGDLLTPGAAPQAAPMPAPAPAPPPVPTPPPAQAQAAPIAPPQAVPTTPPPGPAPTSTPPGDSDTGSALNPQAKMLIASLTGQGGGLGGLGGMGGGLGGMFGQQQQMPMPAPPHVPQMGYGQAPDMSQLAMAGGARNQFGSPMGPAATNPLYMLQRRMMGLA